MDYPREGRLGPVLGIGVLLMVSLTACHRTEEAAHPVELPAADVRVAAVAKGVHRATEEVMGSVRARVRAVIEAKISGRISALPVVPGQSVRAGDVLVELDAQEVQARVDQARAVLQQADRDLARIAALFKQEAVTQAEHDAVESRQRVAKAALAEAETLRSYTRITAPFGGVIARKLAETGDLAAPGRPLLELEDPQSVRFEADLPVMLAERVALGNQLPITLATSGQPMAGTVGEIEPTADPVSRTVRVKLDLPAGAPVRAGSFGRVSVPASEAPILSVPSSAVITRGQMELAFVADGGRAQLRIVRVGKRLGPDTEVLAGLEPGEKVVVEGGGALRDGQPVRIQDTATQR